MRSCVGVCVCVAAVCGGACPARTSSVRPCAPVQGRQPLQISDSVPGALWVGVCGHHMRSGTEGWDAVYRHGGQPVSDRLRRRGRYPQGVCSEIPETRFWPNTQRHHQKLLTSAGVELQRQSGPGARPAPKSANPPCRRRRRTEGKYTVPPDRTSRSLDGTG